MTTFGLRNYQIDGSLILPATDVATLDAALRLMP